MSMPTMEIADANKLPRNRPMMAPAMPSRNPSVRKDERTLRLPTPSAIEVPISPVRSMMLIIIVLEMLSTMIAAMMSFITSINELSSTLLLYTASTTTMPVKVFVTVLDGEFGVAAALSTLLLLCTGACVYAVLRLGQSKESAFL